MLAAVRRRLVLLTALVGVLLAAVPSPASAHVRATTVYIEATSVGADVDAEVELEYDLLVRSAGLGQAAVGAASQHDRARELQGRQEAAVAYVADRLTVTRDSVGCVAEPTSPPSVVERQGVPYAVVALRYDCKGHGAGVHSLTSTLFPVDEGIVDDHDAIVTYDLDGRQGQRTLTSEDSTLTAGEQSVLGQVGEFFVLGVEHLVLGPDHVLFLIALLLGASRTRDVVVLATAFTAAHSVTLLLAAFGVVNVPAWIVEPLIALSIAFVALQALLGAQPRQRVPVVFAFGLMHGLGFAGALSVHGDWSWPLFTSLLGFNVGIEAAQLLLVAAMFPLLILLRRWRFAPAALAGLSIPIVVVALVWFFDRVELG